LAAGTRLVAFTCSVLVVSGAMALTRIFSGPSSTARLWVKPVIASLERGIDRVIGNAAKCLDRRDIDDAAAAGLAQQRDRRACDDEHVAQIDAIERVPLFLGRVAELVADHQEVADIVDDDIQPAKPRLDFSRRLGDSSLDIVGIAGDHQRVRSQCSRARPPPVRRRSRSPRPSGAEGGEAFRDRPPDPRPAAGDQRDLAGQPDQSGFVFNAHIIFPCLGLRHVKSNVRGKE
jgi:hypothetical protein